MPVWALNSEHNCSVGGTKELPHKIISSLFFCGASFLLQPVTDKKLIKHNDDNSRVGLAPPFNRWAKAHPTIPCVCLVFMFDSFIFHRPYVTLSCHCLSIALVRLRGLLLHGRHGLRPVPRGPGPPAPTATRGSCRPEGPGRLPLICRPPQRRFCTPP